MTSDHLHSSTNNSQYPAYISALTTVNALLTQHQRQLSILDLQNGIGDRQCLTCIYKHLDNRHIYGLGIVAYSKRLACSDRVSSLTFFFSIRLMYGFVACTWSALIRQSARPSVYPNNTLVTLAIALWDKYGSRKYV